MTAIPTRSPADVARTLLIRDVMARVGPSITIVQLNGELLRSGHRKTNCNTFEINYIRAFNRSRADGPLLPVPPPLAPSDRLRLLGYSVPTSASTVEERARSLVEIDAADRLGVMIRFVLAVEAIGGASRARRYLDAIERAENAKRAAAIDGMVVVAAVDDAANTNPVPGATGDTNEE